MMSAMRVQPEHGGLRRDANHLPVTSPGWRKPTTHFQHSIILQGFFPTGSRSHRVRCSHTGMRLASSHNSSESLKTSSMQREAGWAGPVQNGEGSQGLI